MNASVGVLGIAQPCARLEHADPGGGEEAHLRRELAGLLAAIGEFGGELAVEEDHGFAHGQTVLRAAEAEHVDAALPGDLRGREAEVRAGVGEAAPSMCSQRPCACWLRRSRAASSTGVDACRLRWPASGSARAAWGSGCPALVTSSSMAPGVILPSSDLATSSLEPLEKNSGAPHSSVSMCEVSWQMML